MRDPGGSPGSLRWTIAGVVGVLAVKELDRTGAFGRKVIVVATTTGTGWLNQEMTDPLEYMYDGDTAIAARPADLDPGSQARERPRVVYLQNANDPIIWGSPSLAFHVPGWLKGPRGPGVSPAMRWYPLVTFWQVSADMADSTSVPAGQGHVYSSLEGASAWASIIPPPGWTPDRTAALARQPET